MNKYKKLTTPSIKKIKKHTLVTAYDDIDKLTLLEWLMEIEKGKQNALTKENEGDGIELTFKEDGTLDKIINKFVIPEDVARLNVDQNWRGHQVFNGNVEVYFDGNSTHYGANTIQRRIGGNVTTINLRAINGTMALTSDLNDKQDKLEAGANIQIYKTPDNRTIIEALSQIGTNWTNISDKPFETIGEGLKVIDGVLSTDLHIPMKTSELQNDSGFITDADLSDYATKVYVDGHHDTTKQDKATLDTDVATLGFIKVTALSNYATIDYVNSYHDATKQDKATLDADIEALGYAKGTIPTKTSELTNDSGFIDDTYHDATKQDKQDDLLETESKNVVDAINEVNRKVEGSTIAYVISTANGKNPNFVSDAYDIEATQIELQDGTIIPIADIKEGTNVYVLEQDVSDRWYSGNGHFIRLQEEKPILDAYQTKEDGGLITTDKTIVGAINGLKNEQDSLDARVESVEDSVSALDTAKQDKASLDTDVGALGYIKSVSWTDIANRPTALSQFTNDVGFITDAYHDATKQDKATLDEDVGALGYIKDTYHDSTKQDKATLDTDVATLGFIKVTALENYATKSYVDNAVSTLRNEVSGISNRVTTLESDKQDKATLDQDVGAKGYIKADAIPHLYEHNIIIKKTAEGVSVTLTLSLLGNTNTPLTLETLKNYLITNSEKSCSGIYISNSYHYLIVYILKTVTNLILFRCISDSTSSLVEITNDYTIDDEIRQII